MESPYWYYIPKFSNIPLLMPIQRPINLPTHCYKLEDQHPSFDRNIDELSKIIATLQYNRKTGRGAPAGWKPGDPGIPTGWKYVGKY